MPIRGSPHIIRGAQEREPTVNSARQDVAMRANARSEQVCVVLRV